MLEDGRLPDDVESLAAFLREEGVPAGARILDGPCGIGRGGLRVWRGGDGGPAGRARPPPRPAAPPPPPPPPPAPPPRPAAARGLRRDPVSRPRNRSGRR